MAWTSLEGWGWRRGMGVGGMEEWCRGLGALPCQGLWGCRGASVALSPLVAGLARAVPWVALQGLQVGGACWGCWALGQVAMEVVVAWLEAWVVAGALGRVA